MARTASNMLALGTQAPHFSLKDTVSQKTVTLSDIKLEKAVVVMFICNHCPFVIHLHEGLQKLVNDYQNKGISFVAISSNDVVKYPEDAPDKMTLLFQQLGFTFPYLYDATQEVAKAFDAACTPDFYVFDQNLKLAYRGQFDSSRPGNDLPVTGEDMRQALDCILQGKPVDSEQKASLGCNIKWKE